MMVTATGAPAGGAEFHFSRRDGWSVVSVGGELNLFTAAGLDDHLAQVLGSQPPPQVTIGLSGLRFCDSSGINALVRAYRRVEAAGGRLVLLQPTPRVTDRLHMTGLDQRLEIRDALPGPATPA